MPELFFGVGFGVIAYSLGAFSLMGFVLGLSLIVFAAVLDAQG